MALKDLRQMGCADYLIKPVKQSRLARLLHGMLPKASTAESPTSSLPHSPNGYIGPLRVLVVDDNSVSQLLMKKLLQRAGCSADIAATGPQAVGMLSQGTYDLVLMDVQMPDMDGYETTRQIRQSPTFGRIPVVAMTAHAMKGDREKCLEAGMNDYLSKPIRASELCEKLRLWLKTEKHSAKS